MEDLSTFSTEKLSDKELFAHIWLKPKKVFKYVTDYRYDKYTFIILIIAGIYRFIESSIDASSAAGMAFKTKLIVSIIAGALFGWLGYYVFAFLISFTAKWMGGKANTDYVVRVLAYAMIPIIPALLCQFLLMYSIGDVFFMVEYDLTNYPFGHKPLSAILALMRDVFSLWSFILLIIATASINNFGILKAILNVILALVVILIPLFILSVLFGNIF